MCKLIRALWRRVLENLLAGCEKSVPPPPPPPEGNPLTEVRLIKHAVRIGETRGI